MSEVSHLFDQDLPVARRTRAVCVRQLQVACDCHYLSILRRQVVEYLRGHSAHAIGGIPDVELSGFNSINRELTGLEICGAFPLRRRVLNGFP